jgi:hypothetical protein
VLPKFKKKQSKTISIEDKLEVITQHGKDENTVNVCLAFCLANGTLCAIHEMVIKLKKLLNQ